MVSTEDFESSNLGSSPSKSLWPSSRACVRYRLVVRIEDFHSFGRGSIPRIGNRVVRPPKTNKKQAWPSGPRRSTQVRVSTDAWVRTPPLAKGRRPGTKTSSYSNSPKFIFESKRRQQNKNLAKSGKFQLLTTFGS